MNTTNILAVSLSAYFMKPQTKQGTEFSFYSERNFFSIDTAALLAFVEKEGIKVVIIDHRFEYSLGKVIFFSPKFFEVSKLLKAIGVETFALLPVMERERIIKGDAGLWWSHQPIILPPTHDRSIDCLAHIENFRATEWERDTGKRFPCSGGDRGLEDLADALRSGRAIADCDWSEIVDEVMLCLRRR